MAINKDIPLFPEDEVERIHGLKLRYYISSAITETHNNIRAH